MALRPGASSAPIHTVEQLCEDTRATPELVKELRDFGVIEGSTVAGAIVFDDDEREIVRAAVELSAGARDLVTEVRGKGLLIGVELNTPARPFAEALREEAILVKETHSTVLRFAPPLIITREEIDWAMERVEKVLTNGHLN